MKITLSIVFVSLVSANALAAQGRVPDQLEQQLSTTDGSAQWYGTWNPRAPYPGQRAGTVALNDAQFNRTLHELSKTDGFDAGVEPVTDESLREARQMAGRSAGIAALPDTVNRELERSDGSP